MPTAHFTFIALAAFTPVLLLVNQIWIDGAIAVYCAFILAVIAVSIRSGEGDHWIKTTRPAIALAAIPAAWLAIQLLPFSLGSFSNSIWQSAATALHIPMLASTTIDPGLTLLAIFRYLLFISIGLIAAAVSIDRQYAYRLFITLAFAMLAGSALSLGTHVFNGQLGDRVQAAMNAANVYGTIVFASLILLIAERYLDRRSRDDVIRVSAGHSVGAFVGMAICPLATFLDRSGGLFAAACGLTTLLVIRLPRWLGFDWRAVLALGFVAITGAALIVASGANSDTTDLSIRFSTRATAESISTTARMIGEVGLGGSGGGTFSATHRVYATQDDSINEAVPPTTAGALAVELGTPALGLIVMLAITLIVLCARGSLKRGRDLVYPTTGAAIGVASLILAFCDIGLNSPGVSLVLSSVLGLALVQSESRST